jgi:hypothetical protein
VSAFMPCRAFGGGGVLTEHCLKLEFAIMNETFDAFTSCTAPDVLAQVEL